MTYLTQDPKPEEEFITENKLNEGSYLVYLDVWERHLTYVEDDYMREKALSGADTASRAQIVWQVRVIHADNISIQQHGAKLELDAIEDSSGLKYSSFINALTTDRKTHPGPGQLKARARKASGQDNEPCLTAPAASYRGAENQLYRVEIHKGSADEDGPTFKWSRENGSVVFSVTKVSDTIITLEHLGRDDRFGLKVNDWVEVLDDDVVLRNEANQLLQVTAVDQENFQVTLSDVAPITFHSNKHPYLRRWDQKTNADKDGVPVKEGDGTKEDDWIALEDGVEILFQRPPGNAVVREEVAEVEVLVQTPRSVYQPGDYWLIPARTNTNDVEWPVDADGERIAQTPHGVEHHYAPLAIINVGSQGDPVDLRRQLKQLWDPAS
ncbi:MAG: hypothetical protein D3910_22630 [Candidatus Electrothrix sp. ATG2]|nr:hypothetical protein [Candidatus Electrothrix sp. ATG2]